MVRFVLIPLLLIAIGNPVAATAVAQQPNQADQQMQQAFGANIRPFLKEYCVTCHGSEEPEAKLDLSGYTNMKTVTGDLGHWEIILQRLEDGEMPPEDADRPDAATRRMVIQWIKDVRRNEANRNAGDPGSVLARRLSNAEYDYTIHDLTGVDIQPTREFPIDPANEAGFANSGESLAMSPALLQKYLGAARHVANHLVLTPSGLDFAPHPVVTESDRDKYCVHRIVDFYKRQPVDYSDYFFAAWRFKHRRNKTHSLSDIALAEQVSAKYLSTIWAVLNDGQDDVGPLKTLRERWRALPDADEQRAVRTACDRLRDDIVKARNQLILVPDARAVDQLKRSLQPKILWINQQIAANRRKGRLPPRDGSEEREQQRRAVTRFCSVFPDVFYVSERGRMFLDPKERNKGRLLSAGFHLMVGYFRDDQPLYDLILDEEQQRELDTLWRELNYVTRAPMRQFRDFIYFERAESTGYLRAKEFDFARGEDDDITSKEKMGRVAKLFVEKARQSGNTTKQLDVIDQFFTDLSAEIRQVEGLVESAQRAHLAALVEIGERAWRRPLEAHEREELLEFYHQVRREQQLSHEEAVRDVMISILMSPRFGYRIDSPPPGKEIQPLSDYALANRLSYFLWSSMPDAELLGHAAAGTLRRQEILVAQMHRMLKDPRVERLAVEFGGNWLDFRQFQQHNGVDRGRFTNFTNELREAMFQEPVRFTVDIIQRDASVLEFVEGRYTFVNPILARHYNIPAGRLSGSQWQRIDDATEYGRGGLLGMSVFLTKNSPGLRTSPVKRGYWVVRRMLGEHIPAPPADVPELPEDESQLGERTLRQLLAKHRESKSCAGCHKRFDSFGLAFEAYGPVGEHRKLDLGGRAVDDRVEFPDGTEGHGIEGLRVYLQSQRRDDFLDHLCRQLLAYALGRSLMLSDDITLEKMRDDLEAGDYRFSRLMESIVTSPQFLNRRGRDYDVGE